MLFPVAPNRCGHLIQDVIRCSVLVCLLWVDPAMVYPASPSVIDPDVPWQSIAISPEHMEDAQLRANALLMYSDLTLLFEAEKTIEMGTLLEPALLIARGESAVDFPDHHPPTSTVLRLKPRQAVEQVFQTLQDEVCRQDPSTLDVSFPDAITRWLPRGVAAVPSAVTTSTSLQFARDVAIAVVVLFFKLGPSEACHATSPYESLF